MKEMKKSKIVLFLLAVSLLSGCSQVSDWVREKGLEKAGLENTEEYKKAQEYQSNSEYKFDANGLAETDFDEEAVAAMAEVKTGIHVTSAENSNLDVKYYSDEARTQEISDIGSVDFNKNDVIYVNAEPKNKDNKLYEFSEIVVYDIGENGEKNNAVNDMWDSENSLIRIPEDYKGDELAIEPLGAYSKCNATFEAYCSNGTTNSPVDCTWTVDGKTYNSSTAELDPTQSHNISVTFEDKDYYYVSSDESSGFRDERDVSGKSVLFQNISFNDKESKFVIKLHKLIKCDISDNEDCIIAVSVNGGSPNEKNKLNLPKLKVGDKIALEMKDGFSAKCTQIKNSTSEKLDNSKKISFVIPETSENIQIITAYEYEELILDNAKVTAINKDTGEVLKNGDLLSGETTITVTITPNEGYTLKGDNFAGINPHISLRTHEFKDDIKMSQYKENKDKSFNIIVKEK